MYQIETRINEMIQVPKVKCQCIIHSQIAKQNKCQYFTHLKNTKGLNFFLTI